MRHYKTKNMQTYWMELLTASGGLQNNGLRIDWPERSDIQPAACREMLGDMFILDIDNIDCSYRLAGTRLCSLLGRELKNECFSASFADRDQRAAESWASSLGQDEFLVLICSDGLSASGEILPMETLLMPLNHHGMRSRRAMGITVPLDDPYWIGTDPIRSQTIRSVRIVRPWEENGFKTNRPVSLPPMRDHTIADEAGDFAPSVQPSFHHLASSGLSGGSALEPHMTGEKRARLTLIQGGKD